LPHKNHLLSQVSNVSSEQSAAEHLPRVVPLTPNESLIKSFLNAKPLPEAPARSCESEFFETQQPTSAFQTSGFLLEPSRPQQGLLAEANSFEKSVASINGKRSPLFAGHVEALKSNLTNLSLKSPGLTQNLKSSDQRLGLKLNLNRDFKAKTPLACAAPYRLPINVKVSPSLLSQAAKPSAANA